MMKISFEKIKLLALWVTISVLLVITFFQFWRPTYFYNSPQFSLKTPDEYTNIFNDSSKSKLILKQSYLLNGRNPYSIFIYDNKYSILEYKLNVLPKKTLKSLIFDDVSGIQKPLFGYASVEAGDGRLDLHLMPKTIPDNKDLLVTLYGNSVVNDLNSPNVYSCNFNMNCIIFSYKNSHQIDFMLENKYPSSKFVKIGMIYINKGTDLFIIFINQIASSSYDLISNPKQLFKKFYF